jgi:hypothetical protein
MVPFNGDVIQTTSGMVSRYVDVSTAVLQNIVPKHNKANSMDKIGTFVKAHLWHREGGLFRPIPYPLDDISLALGRVVPPSCELHCCWYRVLRLSMMLGE